MFLYFSIYIARRPQLTLVEQGVRCDKMKLSAQDSDIFEQFPDAYWQMVFSYLYPRDQLSLAHTCKRMKQIFVHYALKNYATINTSSSAFVSRNLNAEYLEDLLKSMGLFVRSYAAPRDIKYAFTSCEYREYKKNKRHEKLQVMHRHGDPNIINTFGLQLRVLFRRHFELVIDQCRDLESFEFGKRYLTKIVPYELILNLPRLKQLCIWTVGELRTEFLDALEAKPGVPLRCLSIKGLPLPKHQVKRICSIVSLKELCISCKEVPLNSLVRLKQLECLHITMPSITNSELKTLVKGLPHLHTLDLRKCPLITEKFVVKVLHWMNQNQNLRQHLRIYLQGSSVHCERLDKINDNRFIEVIKKEKNELVLMPNELSQEYQ